MRLYSIFIIILGISVIFFILSISLNQNNEIKANNIFKTYKSIKNQAISKNKTIKVDLKNLNKSKIIDKTDSDLCFTAKGYHTDCNGKKIGSFISFGNNDKIYTIIVNCYGQISLYCNKKEQYFSHK